MSTQPIPAPAAPSIDQPSARGRVVFFCKDCMKVVEGMKVGRKYVYRCPLCKTKNVAFGTESSIRSFYHVSDRTEERPAPEKKNPSEEPSEDTPQS